MRILFWSLVALLPWPLKRLIYVKLLGWEIGSGAYVGLSVLAVRRVQLRAGARIGHLSMVKGLDELILGEHACLGNLNWISAFPSATNSAHFAAEPDRQPRLELGDHSAVTHRHIIDCTGAVTIGQFTTIAGFRSQILTHAIDLEAKRQSSAPVTVGNYCLVSTGCILLKGSRLPDRSVLGAGAVLTQPFDKPGGLYGGVPARRIKDLPEGLAYFSRTEGFVW